MRSTLISFFSAIFCFASANAAEPVAKVWPEPMVVPPKYEGAPVPAPTDAVMLFDGMDTSKWKQLPRKEDPDQTDRFRWKVENGFMEVVPRSGMISLREPLITSGHLHIEWATPAEVKGNGQGRGNSGVFIGGFPELQVLDSFENKTYFDGQAGAFYKHRPPLVNACRRPGEWQCYDIHIERAKSNGGSVITVYQNNVLVQDHEQFPAAVKAGLLQLQDHQNPVRYRNIWFKPVP